LAIAVTSTCASAQTTQTPEVIVSATRFSDAVERLPVNASIISAAEIARSTARSIPELLGMRAGIAMRDIYGNDAALSTLDMRGFGASSGQNVLILLDGRPISDVDMSGVQWSSVPLETIERIEILRGSGGVQFGDGASAGTINIVTRHPARDRNGARVGLKAGSWDTHELSAGFNAFGEQAGLYAYVRNHESGGYRDNNQLRQSNVVLNGTWTGASADAALRIAADRQGLRLPGPRAVQPSAGIDLLSTDRRGAATPLDYAQRDGNQISFDMRWNAGPGEFAIGLGYRDKAQRSYFDFSGFPDFRDIDLDVWSLQPRYRWRGDAFGIRHAVVVGLDAARWSYGLLKSNAAANVVQPTNRVSARQNNDAVYLLDTMTLSERVTLNAGVRRERRKLTASDIFDPTAPGGAFGSGATAGEENVRATAYEAGARIGMTNAADLIVRTSRSFRFANVDEIYEFSPVTFGQEFQFLRPQHARTHEIGVVFGKQQPWLRSTLFRMDVTDEIHLDPYFTGSGNRNMPPLRRSGIELEARYAPVREVELTAAYTYTRAKFTQGELGGVSIAGRTVPLVPAHKFDLAGDWQFAPTTRLRARLQAFGEQFMENDEGNNFNRRIPAFHVVDLKLQHQIGRLTAWAGINNLFDRKYYAYAVRSLTTDRFNAYPLPERSFWIGLEYAAF